MDNGTQPHHNVAGHCQTGLKRLFKAKKSEIRLRAKRLLSAFASESRRQKFKSAKRKVIRAHYENGVLLLKEDSIHFPYAEASRLQFQITINLFDVLKKQLLKTRTVELD